MFSLCSNRGLAVVSSAGKDRTGIATMLLLVALGVPEDVVLADFSLSNKAFDHIFQNFCKHQSVAALGIPNNEMRALFIAHPDWLKNLLIYIKERYGGVLAYLTDRAGIPLSTIEALRDHLLD